MTDRDASPPGAPASAPLAAERYVSLETFRRDGRGVRTPVWVAPLEGRLVVVTGGDSHKVARLRRDPRVRLAPCDARGSVRGPWRDGRARLIDDPAHAARAHAALRRKYGVQMRLLDALSRVSGRLRRRTFLEMVLD